MFRKIPELTSIILAICALGILFPASTFAQDASADKYGGLVAIEDSPMLLASIDPAADFTIYQRVMILEPQVAFVDNWRQDQNRSRRKKITKKDMEEIRSNTSSLFWEEFIEALQADDGYQLAEEPGIDVLIIFPAIVDLDITAPETMSAGRARAYAKSVGSATVYVELFDPVSGNIIGRAADRLGAPRTADRHSWSNKATSNEEHRRLVRHWANALRDCLDRHYAIGKQQ